MMVDARSDIWGGAPEREASRPDKIRDQGLPLSSLLLDRYRARVASGELDPDAAQEGIVARLETLGDALRAHADAQPGPLDWLLGRSREPAPRGLYIWGDVGRGKTMLMDLFHEAAPIGPKRRAHFHAFMAEIHERIHAFRQKVRSGDARDTDPIPPVAAAIAAEAALLSFDEFSVTDIADAMILGRLFTALFAEGVVVVATSNVAPDRLYEGGLNRALFLPFIRLLQERMEVVRLEARTDFRMEKLGRAPVYHVPADAKADAALDAVFAGLTGGAPAEPLRLVVKGHALDVPQAARGVARFGFADLCARALGASDYLALAQAFHTIVLDHIPVMDESRRNEAKRFITLIDALYDNGVKFVASAEAEPDALYRAETGREAFEFARTASRLIEMRSDGYLAAPHGRADSVASGSTTGLVET